MEIEPKPQYYDARGKFQYGVLLEECASVYRKMDNETIIEELKKERTRYKRTVSKNPMQAASIYVKRQMLTNAFALNNGATVDDIRLISIERDDVLSQFQMIYDLVVSFLLYKPETHIIPSDPKENMHFLSDSDHIKACLFAEDYTRMNIKSDATLFADYGRTIKSKCADMISKGQFPPYGVSLALDWEDEGQKVLPWSGNLSETTIMSLRKKMHEYAADNKTKACNAIMAAYCCLCFNDEPKHRQAQKEFSTIDLKKAYYSQYVQKRVQELSPWVNRKNKSYIEDLIKDEPFKPIYEELKKILQAETKLL